MVREVTGGQDGQSQGHVVLNFVSQRFLTVIYRFLTVILTKGRYEAIGAAKNPLFTLVCKLFRPALTSRHHYDQMSEGSQVSKITFLRPNSKVAVSH